MHETPGCSQQTGKYSYHSLALLASSWVQFWFMTSMSLSTIIYNFQLPLGQNSSETKHLNKYVQESLPRIVIPFPDKNNTGMTHATKHGRLESLAEQKE